MDLLIAHLIGDYVLQNHWMANRKTSSTPAALLHVTLYLLPFQVIFRPSLVQCAVIAGTHLVIDRFRLARYWVEFWGIGQPGWVLRKLAPATAAGMPDAPPFLSVWLLFIVDNTMHLTINWLALR